MEGRSSPSCGSFCSNDSDCQEYLGNPCTFCYQNECTPMCGVGCSTNKDCQGGGNPCTIVFFFSHYFTFQLLNQKTSVEIKEYALTPFLNAEASVEGHRMPAGFLSINNNKNNNKNNK